MTGKEILQRRLFNQQLVAPGLNTVQNVVEWMGAMQAQEYAMAKWAIGLRLPGSKEQDIERAFNEGKILRTHVMRPTWHFVSPKDIRWMLALTAPRIHQANGFMCRKLGLDDKLLKKAATIFVKALQGGKHMTRYALHESLVKNKITCEVQHLAHIMMYAEAEGIICSGPRKGKQFTYALIDERAPFQEKLSRNESLARLSKLYFTSRGPATLQDYITWSNLTVKDAKEGITLLGKTLLKENHAGRTYFFTDPPVGKMHTLRSFLMPDYDEYGMAYKDRSAIFDSAAYNSYVSRGNIVFNRMIVLDGRVEGTWQKEIKKGKVTVQTFPFSKLNRVQQTALKKIIKDYLDFSGSG